MAVQSATQSNGSALWPSTTMASLMESATTRRRRERQLEEIADAKARGVYKGRKASFDVDKIKKMKTDEMGPSEV
jgi:hypothetical protein